jgi:hypothetical protein
MRRLRLLASNSLIASINVNFRSDKAVRVATDRSGPTGNEPLHENRLAGRESARLWAQPVDAPEPTYIVLTSFTDQGVRNAKDTTKRSDAVKELAKKFGVSAKEFYGRWGVTMSLEYSTHATMHP